MEFKIGDRVKVLETEFTKEKGIEFQLGYIRNTRVNEDIDLFSIRLDCGFIINLYQDSPQEFELIGKLIYHYVI